MQDQTEPNSREDLPRKDGIAGKLGSRLKISLLLVFAGVLVGLLVFNRQTLESEGVFPAPAAISTQSRKVAEYFETIRHDPLALRQFLHTFPKGADLHTHLSGAVYAESYIKWAEAADMCVSVTTYVLSACDSSPDASATNNGKMTLKAALASVPDFRYRLIDAFSTRNYAQGFGSPSSADQFFASFDRFTAIADPHMTEMLAEVLTRAGEQNVGYMEIMMFPGSGPYLGMGADLSWGDYSTTMQASLPELGSSSLDPAVEKEWDDYYGKMAMALNAAGLETMIRTLSQGLDQTMVDTRKTMQCDTPAATAGCQVEVRLLAQGLRDFDNPGSVFALLMACFRLAEINDRVVGVNFVMREDGRYSLRDYALHMSMLAYFKKHYPGVKLSLHAGELTMGLVPPADLHDHIAKAVHIGADRIGHGVDIAYEDGSRALLQSMRGKVLVEINLTSNATILGVKGAQHPFLTYARAGVPVALSTDDEGVLRIDLTHEYVRASLDYGLTYFDLKRLARNALLFSFLPDKEKQAQLQRLEVAFTEFENTAVPATYNNSWSAGLLTGLRRIFHMN